MLLTQEYQENWRFSKKALFKFVFTYFSLYIFLMFTKGLFEAPFRWIGKTILNINYSYDINGFGSGDNTYAYVTLFINVILSILIAVLWIILDNTRKSYNKLLYWFIVLLRVYLIFFMFTYGFVKLIQLQFPYPSLTRMLNPLGDFSPMGLAWTYLGYSKGFNLFMGFMEVLGGLLLIPRRTSTLGAFITMGVMAQVAMMNFMYDIPVKIFSTHLLLIAFFIFSTDLKRFINVFIKNKPTKQYEFYNPVKDITYHKTIFWLKLIFTIGLSGLFLIQGMNNQRSRFSGTKPPLYGVWEVTNYIKNGDTIPPLTTDKIRWRYLVIDKNNMTTVKTMDDQIHPYTFETDSTNHKAKIYGGGIKSKTFNFDYNLSDDILNLKGVLYYDSLDIQLKRKKMLLNTRGFNWINERPYNR